VKDEDGVAAVEFALIVPVLAVIAIMLPDTSDIVFGAMNMNMAVRSSIQYAMNSGNDMSAAQTIGNQTWSNKPHGATLTASTVCTCGSSSGTCGQVCGDGTLPETYVTVTGSATFGGMVVSLPLTTTQKVRVR
jgi:Flp pilus assembly protein TadG